MSPRWLHWPAAAAGGTFIPTDISGCISWFDADDSSTITISTGVSNWADKSGNQGNSPSYFDTGDFTQASTSSQPVVTSAGLNGRDVITFDGADDSLIGRLPYNVTAASLFIVSNPDSDTTWLHINRGGTTYSAIADSGSANTTVNSAFGTPTNYVSGNTVSWANRGDVYTSMGNSVEIYEAINCNLASFSDAATRTYTLCGYGGAFSMTGDIAEIVIYDSALSQSDRESVEGYLAHKWGLTAKLPIGHPYKSVAP